MTDYTPTMLQVAATWMLGTGGDRASFDRWLNAERARAWDEGAEYAWQCTGEGANAEWPGNDGEMSFREFCDVDSNPYRKGDDDE